MFSWIFNFWANHWRWVLLMFSPTTSPRGWKAFFSRICAFLNVKISQNFWGWNTFYWDLTPMLVPQRCSIRLGSGEATLQFLITWSWICRNLTWDFMRFYLFSRIHLHFTSFHPWFEAFFQELWVFDSVQSRMVHRKISYVSSWDLFFFLGCLNVEPLGRTKC